MEICVVLNAWLNRASIRNCKQIKMTNKNNQADYIIRYDAIGYEKRVLVEIRVISDN